VSVASAPTAPATAPPAIRLCPRCYKPFTGGATGIATHLIDEHGVPAMAALAEARGPAETPPPPSPPADAPPAPSTTTKEVPAMAKRNTRPGGDPDKPCGWCKHPKTAHRPGCPKDTPATRGGARTTKPKPAPAKKRGRPKTTGVARVAAPNGADPIATIRGALEQLEAELASARILKAALAQAFPAER